MAWTKPEEPQDTKQRSDKLERREAVRIIAWELA
jgi:hypothetical protein